jgi:hypothetical protein
MLPFCALKWNSHAEFSDIYARVSALGWGSKFQDYMSSTVPEGSFFPFVRMRKRGRGVVREIIDTGCIWIGSRGSYPRIYVGNRFCKWYYPMSFSGRVLKEPFVPFGEIRLHMNYLKSEKTIKMLEHYEEE